MTAMSQQDQDSQTPLPPADTAAAPQADPPPQPVAPPKEPIAWDRPPRNPEEEAFEDDFTLGEGAREPEEPPNDFDTLEPGPTEVVSFASSTRGRNGRGRDFEPEEEDEAPPQSKGFTLAGLLESAGPLFRDKRVALAVAAAIIVLLVILFVALFSAPPGAAGPEAVPDKAAGGQTGSQGAPGR